VGGVLVGDLLVALDGQPVRVAAGLDGPVLDTQVGRPVSLRVLRGGAGR